MKKILSTLLAMLLMGGIVYSQDKKTEKKVMINEEVELIDGVKTIKLTVTTITDGKVTIIDTSFAADESYDRQAVLSSLGVNPPSDSIKKKMVLVKEIEDEDIKVMIKMSPDSTGEFKEHKVIHTDSAIDIVKRIVINKDDIKMEGDSGMVKLIELEELIGDSTIKIEKQMIIMVRVKVEDLTDEERKEMIDNKVFSKKAEPIDDVDLKVYPNPSSGTMKIEFKLDTKADTEVSIHDAKGEELFTETIKDFIGSYSKDVTINREPGVYFLSVVQDGKRVFSKKIVLE